MYHQEIVIKTFQAVNFIIERPISHRLETTLRLSKNSVPVYLGSVMNAFPSC